MTDRITDAEVAEYKRLAEHWNTAQPGSLGRRIWGKRFAEEAVPRLCDEWVRLTDRCASLEREFDRMSRMTIEQFLNWRSTVEKAREVCGQKEEKMDELISRKALLEAMKQSLGYRMKAQGMDKAVDMVQNAPTIDPVRHAHWWAPFAGCAICSACNEEQDVEMFVGNPVQKYCARCGARMDQEDGGGRDE